MSGGEFTASTAREISEGVECKGAVAPIGLFKEDVYRAERRKGKQE